MTNARETVLHVAECDEDALAIIGDALFVSRFRALEVREVSAAGENRERKARAMDQTRLSN